MGIKLMDKLLVWVIVLTAFAGIVTIRSVLTPGPKIKKSHTIITTPAGLAFAFWMLMIGCVLPLATLHTDNNLVRWPIALITLVGAGGLGMMLMEFVREQPARLREYALFTAAVLPVLLALAA